ncbi:cell wall anchor protein, partial [Streptomyces sp. NPDC002130]
MSRTSPHTHHEGGRVSRRGLLKTAGGLTAALALGATATATTAGAAPATFTHPGMLHNAGDINRAKVRVAAGDDPWLSGWNKLTANSHSQSTWTNRATAT